MTGSQIAKGGFENEKEVADKFNNWKTDADARQWLQLMMYDLEQIESVQAKKIGEKGYKSDIYVTVRIIIRRRNKDYLLESVENIQVKLVSSAGSGYNQVEKRRVSAYVKDWHMTKEIATLLKHFDGELPPREGGKDEKRMFANEFTATEQKMLVDYFQKHLVMIVSDVIRGRGRFASEWTLVINKHDGYYRWCLLAVNEAISIYCGDCKAEITPRGSFRLGNITLQRKGGDKGADSANMLQFKADPLILFSSDD